MTTLNSKPQQYTVTPRDFATPAPDAEATIRQQLAKAPDATFVDWDAHNRIAIIEAPENAIASLRETLGDQFFVDVNAPLQY